MVLNKMQILHKSPEKNGQNEATFTGIVAIMIFNDYLTLLTE